MICRVLNTEGGELGDVRINLLEEKTMCKRHLKDERVKRRYCESEVA